MIMYQNERRHSGTVSFWTKPVAILKQLRLLANLVKESELEKLLVN